MTRNLPFGDIVVEGIECIVGSAMYLKSTGTSLEYNRKFILAIYKFKAIISKALFKKVKFYMISKQ